MQDAVGPGGGAGVVRDQDDRLVQAGAQLAQQVENLLGAFGVEVAGRFVGDDQRRIGDDRPGDADALLLAAGKLAGAMPRSIRQADQVQRGFDLLAPAAAESGNSNSGNSTFSYAVSTGSR